MQIINRTRLLLHRLKNIMGLKPLMLCAAVLASLLVLLITLPSSTSWPEFYLYDRMHSLAAEFRAASPDLVVVGIDMKTLAAREKRWPWPRQDVADSLRLLSRLQPRGIIVDILFQNSDSETGDAQLEQAIAEIGNLLLISLLEEKKTPQGVSLARFTSLSRFSDKALGEGFVWGLIDHDGRLRSFKISDERLSAVSSALLAFKCFLKPETDFVENLPVEAPVVFARKNGGIPVISLRDIAGNEDQFMQLCRDKILILGVNAPIVHDYHNTALGITSGVEVLASSLDTLVSRRIGRILFDHRAYRSIMAATGMFLGWIGVMSGVSLLITPLIFVVLVMLLLVFSQISLLHLPVAVMIIAWLASSLILYTARYFDNLFNLRTMQQDAANARLVQEQLLPKEELFFKGYRVFGISRSADELGGDYFDYFVVKDRYLLVIIGDVTGHGMAAALAMAIGKAAVLLGLENCFTSGQLAESINSVLFGALRRKLMMTVAFLRIDTETHTFEYLNCGHPYPYLLKDDGNIEQLAASGLFLGTKATYRPGLPHTGSLKNTERMVFYTDGLIESMPASREEDAFDLFRDYLARRPKLPLQQACCDVLENHPFILSKQPQPDDFTVLMVERTTA